MSTTLQEDILQTTVKQAATIALLELQLRQAQAEIEALKSTEPSPQVTPDLLREVRQVIEMHLKVDGCIPADCWPDFAHQTLSKVAEILGLPEIPAPRAKDPVPEIRAVLQRHKVNAVNDDSWPAVSWDALREISKITGEAVPTPVPYRFKNGPLYERLFDNVVTLLGCNFDVDSVWEHVRAQSEKVNRVRNWIAMHEAGSLSASDLIRNITSEVTTTKAWRQQVPTIDNLRDDLLVERARSTRATSILESVRMALHDPTVGNPLDVVRRLLQG